ncbi:hypothetical protein N9Z38_00420 [Mariniblastus sp.]|nr:hypothetical protein [Mariniblastus sp.]
MLSFDRIIGIDWSGSNSDWGVAEWQGSGIVHAKLPDLMLLTDNQLQEAVDQLAACPLPRTAPKKQSGIGNEYKNFRSAVDRNLQHIEEGKWHEVLNKGLGRNVLLGLERFCGIDIPRDLREAYLPIVKHSQIKTNTWRLPNIIRFLTHALKANSDKRTLVLVDAALGYPAGFTKAVFGGEGWEDLLARFGAFYNKLANGMKPIDVAREINKKLADDGSPPAFAMSEEWPTIAFYTKNKMSPFRLVDQLLVGAKSPLDFRQTTLGKVGGHTISCLSAISKLRNDPVVSFLFWPQEVYDTEKLARSKHVIAEVYPAIFDVDDTASLQETTEHERDARKVVKWAVKSQTNQMLGNAFDLNRFGFNDDWLEKIREEGWILGLDE